MLLSVELKAIGAQVSATVSSDLEQTEFGSVCKKGLDKNDT